MTAGKPHPEAFEVKDDKILRHLFNSSSEDGAPKGDFLMRFGFSPDRPLELMEALVEPPSLETWTQAFEAPHGVKFYFEGPLRSPDGRNPVIRTVWQIDYDGDGRTARFITIKIRLPRDRDRAYCVRLLEGVRWRVAPEVTHDEWATRFVTKH